MLDLSDLTFRDALEREIKKRLDGDGKTDGLYRSLLGGDWELTTRTRGVIYGYEQVLEMMQDVARRMNEGEEPVRVGGRRL